MYCPNVLSTRISSLYVSPRFTQQMLSCRSLGGSISSPTLPLAFRALLDSLSNDSSVNGTSALTSILASFVSSAASATGVLPSAVSTALSFGDPTAIGFSGTGTGAGGESHDLDSPGTALVIGVSVGATCALLCVVLAVAACVCHRRRQQKRLPSSIRVHVGEDPNFVFGVNPMQSARAPLETAGTMPIRSASIRVSMPPAAGRAARTAPPSAAAPTSQNRSYRSAAVVEDTSLSFKPPSHQLSNRKTASTSSAGMPTAADDPLGPEARRGAGASATSAKIKQASPLFSIYDVHATSAGAPPTAVGPAGSSLQLCKRDASDSEFNMPNPLRRHPGRIVNTASKGASRTAVAVQSPGDCEAGSQPRSRASGLEVSVTALSQTHTIPLLLRNIDRARSSPPPSPQPASDSPLSLI
jgi:hypothetical protein